MAGRPPTYQSEDERPISVSLRVLVRSMRKLNSGCRCGA